MNPVSNICQTACLPKPHWPLRVRSLPPGVLGPEGFYRRISGTLRSIGGYLALSGLEIQFTGAYEVVEFPLKGIFHTGVPGRCFTRLRPKVTNRIGPPQREGNQVINFVIASFVLGDSILGVRLFLKPRRHRSHLLCVARNTRPQRLRRMCHPALASDREELVLVVGQGRPERGTRRLGRVESASASL